MVAVWPASLPQSFQASGYREKQANNLIRTQMEAGPMKVRRRFTAGYGEITGAMWMTAAQVAIFRSFYESTLEDGALTFTMIHPVTGAEITCRVKEPPTYENSGGDINSVNLVLEVLP